MAYASKQSTAIDYGRQGRQTAASQVRALPESRKRRAPAKVPYLKYTAIFGCVFAVLLVIVSSYMEVTELTSKTASMKRELETLQSDENALNAKKEQVFNLVYVEDVAKSNLGMIKLDKSMVQYVDMSSPEKTTITEDTAKAPAFIAGLFKSFNAVVEYLN